MKTKLIVMVISLSLLFWSGCAGVSLKDNTTQVSIDIAASTIGYVAGQKNLDQIPKWNKWIDKILALEAGASTTSYEKLLAIALDAVCDDPFLAMQFGKLTKLLDFPELQPPDLPFLKAEYVELVKIVMGGLKDGLVAAQAANS